MYRQSTVVVSLQFIVPSLLVCYYARGTALHIALQVAFEENHIVQLVVFLMAEKLLISFFHLTLVVVCFVT